MAPEGGVRVSRTTSRSCADEKVQAGREVFYSVFVDRNGVFSKGVSSRAVLVTHEVSNFNLEAGDGLVRCSWDFSVPEARVHLFRQEGNAPGAPGDGVEITPSSPPSVIDRDVKNGCLYYYRIVVEYRDNNGQSVFT